MVVATNSTGTTKGAINSFTTLPSANATLSGLSASAGTLSPAFVSQTVNYTFTVPYATASTTVKPTTASSFSTVAVNGTAVPRGSASAPVPLNTGSNIINIIVTAQDGVTAKTYKITVTRTTASLNASYYTVTKPVGDLQNPVDNGVLVHPALSPNGDGINDVLTIAGINSYPNNTVSIFNVNGVVVYEARGYDNGSKAFDGHSNKTAAMQPAGTYFYTLEYKVNNEIKRKSGYIVLKY
jgi:gliding motility-associated-like protein